MRIVAVGIVLRYWCCIARKKITPYPNQYLKKRTYPTKQTTYFIDLSSQHNEKQPSNTNRKNNKVTAHIPIKATGEYGEIRETKNYLESTQDFQ